MPRWPRPAALPGSRGCQLIGLVQLNVWIDVLFTVLYVIIIVALSGHFSATSLTGRAKRRFVNWEWPHHEGGPIPVMPKVLHIPHVTAMIALCVSGALHPFPVLQWGPHVHAMGSLRCDDHRRINSSWRSATHLALARRDYREFAITKRDITTAPEGGPLLHLREKSEPHLGKYNVMQKGTYIIFAPLLVLQAFTGFALLTSRHTVHQHVPARYPRRLVARGHARVGRPGRLVGCGRRTTSSTGYSSF